MGIRFFINTPQSEIAARLNTDTQAVQTAVTSHLIANLVYTPSFIPSFLPSFVPYLFGPFCCLAVDVVVVVVVVGGSVGFGINVTAMATM